MFYDILSALYVVALFFAAVGLILYCIVTIKDRIKWEQYIKKLNEMEETKRKNYFSFMEGEDDLK